MFFEPPSSRQFLSNGRWSWAGAILIVTLVTAGCSGWSHREEAFAPQTVDFSNADTGKLPPDFTTALTGGGDTTSWVVREDSTAPAGPKVLVQESADDTSYRFPLCIYGKLSPATWRPKSVTKALSGKKPMKPWRPGAPRYTPGKLLHRPGQSALEDNVNLFKTVHGKRTKSSRKFPSK